MPQARWTMAAVAALTLAALALRLTGIGYTLPHRLEPDGGLIQRRMRLLREPNADEEWIVHEARRYPELIAHLVALLPAPGGEPPAADDRAGHMARAAAPYVQIRIVVAVLSVLIVPGTWLLARAFLAPRAALFAAALVGFSLLHLLFSQQGRPHTPAASFVLLAVVAALHAQRRASPAASGIAGLLAGAGMGALQSGAAVLPALVVAHLLRETSWPARLRGTLLAVLLSGAVAMPFYPESSLWSTADGAEGSDHVLFFGHRLYLRLFNGDGSATVFATLWSLENVATCLAALGLGALLVRVWRAPRDFRPRARPGLWTVAAHALPYTLLICLYARTFDRFCIPLLPYLACLAAYGLERVAKLSRVRAAFPVLALLALAVPATGAVRFVAHRLRPDSAAEAARWIEAHLTHGERLQLLPPLELPLLRTRAALVADAQMRWSSAWRAYLSIDEAARYPDLPPVRARLHQLEVSWRTVLPLLPPETEDTQRHDVRSWPLWSAQDLATAAANPLGYLSAAQADCVVLILPPPLESLPYLESFHAALRDGARLLWRGPENVSRERPVLLNGYHPSRSKENWTWRLLGDFGAAEEVIEIYALEQR